MLSDTDQLKIINIDTEKIETLNIVNEVRVAKWHPRQSHKILLGTENGSIRLYNIEKKQVEFEYAGSYNA